MDPIKQAFQKIKQDIFYLHEQILEIKQQIKQLNQRKNQKNNENSENFTPTIPTQTPTQTPFQTDTPTQTPTLPQEVGGLKHPNLAISTGNQGVPTDKPTDRQTNQQTDRQSHLHRVKEILANLDGLKKELRIKFKRLTSKELEVFSLLYGLEDQGQIVDYPLLATKLNLSESSIRD